MEKKVYIEYQFREGPYGGANQFLKNLRDYFIEQRMYTSNPREADFILINHTNISKETIRLKREYPDKIFIHRMDGPVSMHRKHTLALDKQSFYLDKLLCNGTVFQSTWTKENCFRLGYLQTGLCKVINNAPNPVIFEREQRIKERNFENQKIKLVTTSWSPNPSKGFDIYQYLDENLDFTKYEYTFIGRTNISFKNIKVIPPLKTEELAKELKKQDIFIAASKSESCSNSLIEAMNCGLPVVARESGCYREVVKSGGIIFKEKEDSIRAIEEVVDDWKGYSGKLPFYCMEDIGGQYSEFLFEIESTIQKGKIKAKRMTLFNLLVWKIYSRYMKVYIKVTDYYVNHMKRERTENRNDEK